ncbi:TonB-dependent receptor [Oleiagrimonas soli]|nr:TonB-dependent receptor [Oleiagrimonas soli]
MQHAGAPPTSVAVRGYAVAAGSLRTALRQLAQQSGLQLDGIEHIPASAHSADLHGDFRADEALRRLLAGSGWQAEHVGPSRFRLVDTRDITPLASVVTTASVDNLSTEGTGSYTTAAETTATRLPLTLRQTPESVSVITRTQMDDFGLDDVRSVLANTTGINVEQVETDRTYYSARGFDVTNFLVDGLGMPFTNGAQWGDMDTAVYDHIEVLRGANGLLSFTGNPSATINFVRKRPTAEFQGSAGLTVSSWDTRRLDLDLSGPLNDSASVRGRLIAADQDGDSYLDRYSLHKQVISGIVEADVGESTLLSAGLTDQRNRPKGVMWGALPLYYTDGSATDFDRATSTATDWAYWNSDDVRTFAQLEHDFAHGWILKFELNHRRFSSRSDLFYIYGTPDRTTGLGLLSYPSHYTDVNRQDTADLSVSGTFDLAGRTHQLVFGANAARNKETEQSLYGNDVGTPLPPLQDWNGVYPKPVFDAYRADAAFDIRRQSAYVTARWNLTDPLKLITGASVTRIRSRGESYGVPHRYTATRNTPYAGLVYDLGKHLSAYASYAKIFSPQTEVDLDNRVLPPITGSNLETGLKGAWFDERLNASFALFRTRQDHTAESAGFNPDTGQTYYRGVNATSKGYEFDVAGRLTPGWEISAGYTQLGITGDRGTNVRTYVPRRTLHLSTSYRVPALRGLKVGANLRWQDAITRDQGVLDTQGREIVTRQGAYALLGLMARYDFDPSWSATLNVDNVTNRKYLTSLYWNQAYYGAPRHYSLNVTWRF